ncbi:MAG: hypothetical protein JNM17_13195 [Archangium sp.]|nr:hypothetical protein [Archangium sp.]
MAIQIQGNGGVVADVGGITFRALKVQQAPIEHGALGHYSYGGLTGVLPAALAANSEIFQFRWSDATRLAVVRKVRISACVSTTFFAAGVPVQIDLLKANTWTAVGTGGTRPAAAALLKKRANMGNSLLGANDVGIATTAALGAGTKTLEGLSMCTIVAPGPITASLNGQIIAPGTILFQHEVGDGEHPLVLAQNEGFVIRSVAVPATGTWQAAINVDWVEVAAY